MLRQSSRKKDVKDIWFSRLHLFLFVGFLVDGPKKKNTKIQLNISKACKVLLPATCPRARERHCAQAARATLGTCRTTGAGSAKTASMDGPGSARPAAGTGTTARRAAGRQRGCAPLKTPHKPSTGQGDGEPDRPGGLPLPRCQRRDLQGAVAWLRGRSSHGQTKQRRGTQEQGRKPAQSGELLTRPWPRGINHHRLPLAADRGARGWRPWI